MNVQWTQAPKLAAVLEEGSNRLVEDRRQRHHSNAFALVLFDRKCSLTSGGIWGRHTKQYCGITNQPCCASFHAGKLQIDPEYCRRGSSLPGWGGHSSGPPHQACKGSRPQASALLHRTCIRNRGQKTGMSLWTMESGTHSSVYLSSSELCRCDVKRRI